MCSICESEFIKEDGTNFEVIGLESGNYIDIDLVHDIVNNEYLLRATSERSVYSHITYCPYCGKKLKKNV